MSARGRTWRAPSPRRATPGELAAGDGHAPARHPSAATTALLAAIPCVALTAAAAALLGPPLGRALFAPGEARFLIPQLARPEPTEDARFAIAVLAPFALALVVALRGRRQARRARTDPRAATRAAELLLLALAAGLVLAQHVLAYRVGAGRIYSEHRVYFTGVTLAAAVAIAAALVALLRDRGATARAQSLVRETRARRLVALALAAALVAIWLATAFNTEGSIGRADVSVVENVAIWVDEALAVLNGRMPLAGFHPQYAQLWPYAAAGTMALFGASLGVYAAAIAAFTGAALLAVFATFRRVAGSSLLALALFAPFVATSFFKIHGTLANRYSPASLYSLFPIRYGGPYVLAWLLARQLDGARPRRPTALCFAAGLVALNNPEFGVPAFAATLAALLWTMPQPTWANAARRLGAGAIGAAGAALAVTLLTLAAAGALPRFSQLLEFARIYGPEGFGMLPMPVAGVHLAIYLTFAAALVVATARSVDRARDATLTGLLCWIGVFGLGACGYYAGRSFPDVLIDLFSPWAFALALLLVAAVRATLARPSRTPTAAELAVLVAFGVAVCSLAQTPLPWTQLARLTRAPAARVLQAPAADRFVRAHSVPGEHVLIMARLGHRIAAHAGVTDVFPYPDLASAVTVEQWEAIDRLAQAQRVRSAFVDAAALELVLPQLSQAGFRVATPDAASQLVKLVRLGAGAAGQ